MAINSIQANNAYMNALKSIGDSEQKSTKAVDFGAEQTGSFGNMVSDTVNQVVNSGQKADDKIMAQAVGKVDVVDVVTAVAETEVAVQTLVSVRDRVISAYQDILRMPI